ncbi:desulfoglucosinolate sulfotransferase A/B/C [Vigna unguiculata]|uniref:Sulfotransferase n=1 Tax=Vigna unguiculata TaxID=3917 RepID=A0A4D6LAT6_VIGUN|nr:desulfoglucosinolate sulfotransferase A/B/C [Vigna unguiculata]
MHELTIEETLEKYCKGILGFGPTWEHMLGYWKESIANPNKVLFLKYEELKEDVNFYVKRVAEFLDCPFTEEEESSGVIESIINLCSLEKMKNLEVNKAGTFCGNFEKKYLFRKGEIGDWVNYFSPAMIEKLSKTMEEKLEGSGLSFETSS